MPTTVNLRNLPDPLVRSAKAVATERGISLKEFVIRALSQEIAGKSGEVLTVDPPAEAPRRDCPFFATPEGTEARLKSLGSVRHNPPPLLPVYCQHGREYCILCGGFARKPGL